MKNLTKEERFLRNYINKQFDVAGHSMTYDGLKEAGLFDGTEKEEDEWYMIYTMNQDQEDEIKKWFISEYARTFRVNKKKGENSATKAWEYFNNTWGLDRNDYTEFEEID